MTTIARTRAADLKAGDKFFAASTGKFRTIKTVTRVPGKQAVKVVFASKDRAVFALDAVLPVVA